MIIGIVVESTVQRVVHLFGSVKGKPKGTPPFWTKRRTHHTIYIYRDIDVYIYIYAYVSNRDTLIYLCIYTLSLLLGRLAEVAPDYEAAELGVGDSIIIKALCENFGRPWPRSRQSGPVLQMGRSGFLEEILVCWGVAFKGHYGESNFFFFWREGGEAILRHTQI